MKLMKSAMTGKNLLKALSKVAAIVCGCAVAYAGSAEQAHKNLSATTITPIFSQLMGTGYPAGFTTAFEKAQPQSYLREAVLTGETVDHWTQIITVTGIKGLAAKPGLTPKVVFDAMAGGFKRACPGSFSAQSINNHKVSGFDAIAAVVSCGATPMTRGTTSETALIVVIKGVADVYTVQWAERAAPSREPIPVDVAKWSDRYNKLGPLKLCPIIPGERAPYPSCVGPAERTK